MRWQDVGGLQLGCPSGVSFGFLPCSCFFGNPSPSLVQKQLLSLLICLLPAFPDSV